MTRSEYPPLEINVNEHGLFYFVTPPLKLKAFATACDPSIPWVFIASHDVYKSSSEFFPVSLPLRADHPPKLRTVRGFSVDLLMTWEEFQGALGELAGDGSAGTGGVRFWQLTREPTRRYQLDRVKPESLVPVYRNQGVVLSFQLPHNDELGMVSSHDEKVLRLALDRLKPALR